MQCLSGQASRVRERLAHRSPEARGTLAVVSAHSHDAPILGGMKSLSTAAILCLIPILLAARPRPSPKQAQTRPEPDMCAVPPGAQPLLPAKLLPGMGTTRNFP